MEKAPTEILDFLQKFKFEFDPRYLIDRIILQHGCWEPQVLSYISNFTKPGMLAVDVGANAGYHTLLMADLVGPNGQVYAFEPNPDTRQRLIRNLELNPEVQDRVRVCSEGIGSAEETLYVFSDDRPQSLGNASLCKEPPSDHSLAIQVVRLDDYIKSPISLIKIDVEGMELGVLEGCEKHIEDDRPIIIYETLVTSAPEVHKPIEDFLKQYDYRIFCPSLNGENLVEISYPIYPYDDCVAIYAKNV